MTDLVTNPEFLVNGKIVRLHITVGCDPDTEQEIVEELNWLEIINNINEFIKSSYKTIKKIEDKQIGFWFIKPDEKAQISLEKVKYKLMFYLWDSVFDRDKKPLEEIVSKAVGKEIKLVTYDDFVQYTSQFLLYLNEKQTE